MKQLLAILTSDIHLRSTVPIARTEGYVDQQWMKMLFLYKLQRMHKVPILDAGDFFHTWDSPPALLYKSIEFLNKINMYTIPGNHDIPNHNVSLLNNGGLGVLGIASDNLHILNSTWVNFNDFYLYGLPYGCKEIEPLKTNKKKILLTHEMVWDKIKVYPSLTQNTQAISILNKYPEFDIIVSGHNHQSFVVKHNNRLLINPGSMMRMFADQIDFYPRCFLLYSDNSVVPMPYPINRDAFDLNHINNLNLKKEHQKRLESKLDNNDYTDQCKILGCKKIIERYIENNRIRQQTKEILLDLIK